MGFRTAGHKWISGGPIAQGIALAPKWAGAWESWTLHEVTVKADDEASSASTSAVSSAASSSSSSSSSPCASAVGSSPVRGVLHRQSTWRVGDEFLIGVQMEKSDGPGYHLAAQPNGLLDRVTGFASIVPFSDCRPLPAHLCWTLSVLEVTDVNFVVSLCNQSTQRLLSTAGFDALRGSLFFKQVATIKGKHEAQKQEMWGMGVSTHHTDKSFHTRRPCLISLAFLACVVLLSAPRTARSACATIGISGCAVRL